MSSSPTWPTQCDPVPPSVTLYKQKKHREDSGYFPVAEQLLNMNSALRSTHAQHSKVKKKSWNINPQMETHNRYSGVLALKKKEILSCGKHASTLRTFYQVKKPLNKKTNTL